MAHRDQVIFNASEDQRRRESLGEIRREPKTANLRTSCFVHSLLSNHRLENEASQNDEAREDGHTTDYKHDHWDEQGKQSRLLTKRQLADMARSIRELSTKLGRFNIKLKVRSIFLLTKAHDEDLISKTRELAQWLLSGECGGPYVV